MVPRNIIVEKSQNEWIFIFMQNIWGIFLSVHPNRFSKSRSNSSFKIFFIFIFLFLFDICGKHSDIKMNYFVMLSFCAVLSIEVVSITTASKKIIFLLKNKLHFFGLTCNIFFWNLFLVWKFAEFYSHWLNTSGKKWKKHNCQCTPSKRR